MELVFINQEAEQILCKGIRLSLCYIVKYML